MTTYIVTFEVNDNFKKDQLKEKLKQYSGYCPIHDNCWAVISDQSASQIRDFLSKDLPASERIFVIRSGIEAAWTNPYSTNNSEWLKERL
ncbi:MAG: hypothetical protein OXH00_09590 [Candidatus Poribacteria bacterium]|nr:hypothetical protein [Candidatus Poribacteria bacterium]